VRERKDFVQVRLTSAGLAFAGEAGVLRLGTSKMNYVFTGEQSTEVLRAGEWPFLQAECDGDGNALFEELPDPVAAAPSATPPPPPAPTSTDEEHE
jgi:hypothetical protein